MPCGAHGSGEALVGPFTAEGDGGEGEGVVRKRGGWGLDEGPSMLLHQWSEQKSLKHGCSQSLCKEMLSTDLKVPKSDSTMGQFCTRKETLV